MAKSTNTIGRRGFIVGTAVAALATPTVAAAIGSRPRWEPGSHTRALRAAYLAELERFAETLRPRFESGELHADRDEDLAGWEERETPQRRLERLCGEHFGIAVTRTGPDRFGYMWNEGDESAAYFVLAVSPHAGATRDTQEHPGYHAQEAVTWDVLEVARSRGWYSPTEDECEDPTIDVGCECGHRLSAHRDGCQALDCDCGLQHVPREPGRAS